MAQQALAEEIDERFAELAVHLSAQDVESIGGCGEDGDLHVAVLMLALELLWRRKDAWVFVAELQEAFHAARAVFRALAIVAVRQAHHETRSLEPFHLARSNELVNDALSIVGKITELSFPDDKSSWR